jgi:hypothetical protein
LPSLELGQERALPLSFCFLWSSNGILFMLPTILTQRGFPLSEALVFQAVFGYTACAF